MFTEEHEEALAEYLRDIAVAKADSSKMAGELIDLDNRLNELWGQIDYVLYVLEDGQITRTILEKKKKEEQAEIGTEDA